MKLEQSFEVEAPADRVWAALIDIERVVPCLPGAAVTGRDEEGGYDGTFSVKIGPTTASYKGKLKLEEVDETARSARLQANGTDRRGQGGARATIVSEVHTGNGGPTRVRVVTDYHITGRLARFGRGGMIEDIAGRLLREFAQRLQASLVDGGQAQADEGQAQAGAEAAEAEAATQAGTSPPGAQPEQQTAPPPSSGATPSPESDFTPQPEVEPLQAGSLVRSVLLDRARGNPPAVAAAIAGLLLALVLLRRRR